MHNIIVVGPSAYAYPIYNFSRTLYAFDYGIQNGYDEIVKLIELYHVDIEMVLFTGGEDVSPELYDGQKSGMSYVNEERDLVECKIFTLCKKYDIKVSGICRGFQFINVMAGGRMYQHIQHPGYHNAYFAPFDEHYLVSSTHHQLVDINDEAISLIWTEPSLSPFYFDYRCIKIKDAVKEVEGAIFPNINGFGVQFHPEIMKITDPGVAAYQTIMEDFLNYSFDKFIRLYKSKSGGSKCQKKSLNL